MRRVGLTGNIAAGKSAVARLLAGRHGLPVIDTDQVAREVVARGSPVLAALVSRFGAAILAPDGSLDRATLARRVLADADARADLEALTHPAIWARVEAWLAEREHAAARAAVVEATLIVETAQQARFDTLVVVTCAAEAQVARLVADRGMSAEGAGAWLAAQLPASVKERAADVVIRNDGDLADLERAVAAALPRILGDL
jgi:dephospho-CoA kinase